MPFKHLACGSHLNTGIQTGHGIKLEVIPMKRLLAIAVAGVMFAGIAGCSDKATIKTEKEITTPDGKTTITDEKTIKQSGNNPPAP